ncbi:MAG: hypothetical protein LBR70_02905 [Lactobacillaceae bacterium]|jgi:hypothetical protein|nr:hypothetical protein [Lactobacillaceae bacterium]
MKKYILFVLLFFLCVLYFLWGVKESNKAVRADCEKEIVIKEKERIKYVYRAKEKIYSEPNAGRDVLLMLMCSGKL